MLLSARLLQNVQNLNSFGYTDTLKWSQGDKPDFYVQLADISGPHAGEYPRGLRYCASAGATLKVELKDVNGSIADGLSATRPFAGDASIWVVPFSALTMAQVGSLSGTFGLKLTLFEDPITTFGFLSQAVSIARTTVEF